MDEQELLRTRFWLVVVTGGLLAIFGIFANGLLTRLFLSSPNFRHSPFFFLGFMALFDTFLDAVYIFLLKTSVRRVQFDNRPPNIFDITPLTEKPLGIVRMPEASRNQQEDMDSPISQLIHKLAADEEVGGGVVKQETEEEEDESSTRSSVENINVSESVMQPRRSADELMDSVNGGPFVFAVPKIELEEKRSLAGSSTTDEPNTSPSVVLKGKHMLTEEEALTFDHGHSKRQQAGTQLWSQLFMPLSREHFFTRSQCDYQQMLDWLAQWRTRLDCLREEAERKRKEEEEKGRKKRRRSVFEQEEEEDNDDEDFQPPTLAAEPPSNPVVLDGPTGCGKTAMVYASAKSAGFEVIEVSASSVRNGQALKNRLAGALQNHNVLRNGNNSPGDIRAHLSSLLGQRRRVEGKKGGGEHSLILIDECDLVFDADKHFWPALKDICVDSQIPIVLTCNDYKLVAGELGKEPVAVSNYKPVHMDRPTTQQLTQLLRPWLLGLTDHYQNMRSLCRLAERKAHDPRAILNELQLAGMASGAEQRRRSLEEAERGSADCEPKPAGTLGQAAKRARLQAELDAACGPTGPGRISLFAKLTADLDYAGGQFHRVAASSLEGSMEERAELRAQLVEATKLMMDSNNIQGNKAELEQKKVVAMARRCTKGRLRSVAETSLDVLPCLLALDQQWTSRRRHSMQPFSHRAPPHPFEQVDPHTGSSIDASGCLKTFIHKQRFSNDDA